MLGKVFHMLDKIEDHIYRLRLPFEGFYTSVYIYRCPQGVALIDCAADADDVDAYIIPTLQKLNIAAEDVKYILLSHSHRDHRGGLCRLSEVLSGAVVCTACRIPERDRELIDGMQILGNLRAVAIPGHTPDSFGFFDSASGTLLSADCLQLDGVDKYRNGISDFNAYISSVEKLKALEIHRIVAAHEYIPLGSVADGAAAVQHYLDECVNIARRKMK